MTVRPLLFRLIGAALLLTEAGPARAQTVDYGKLEELFGEPVTTSATGIPQLARDLPVAMQIITQDEIKRSGAADIPGVLRHVMGIQAQQWSRTATDIGIRGYNKPFSNRVLVLINGRQVYLDNYGLTIWSALPVELADIRQIEVVEGPASALFGFNAASGVINIVTFSPLYDAVNVAEASLGTQDFQRLSAVKTIKLSDQAGVRLSVGGHDGSDFSTPIPADQQAFRFGPTRRSVSADSVAQIGDHTQAGLEFTHVKVRESQFGPTLQMGYSNFTVESAKGFVASETALGLITATGYVNTAQIAGDNLGFPEDSHNLVAVTKLEDMFRLGNDHLFRLAGEYRSNTIKVRPIGGADVFYDVKSLSGMWNWAIIPSVTTTTAGRLDELNLGRSGVEHPELGQTNAPFNRSISEPSFNWATVWHADRQDTLRASVSRGSQIPNLTDFGGFQNIFTFADGSRIAVIGNPALKPMVVTNYELGWDRDIAALRGQAKLRLFHQTSRDVISATDEAGPLLPPLTVMPVYMQGNMGNSRETGVEWGLSGVLTPQLAWDASYTLLKVTDSFITAVGDGTLTDATDYAHTTPRHDIKLHGAWTSGPWQADVFGQYLSRSNAVAPTDATGTIFTHVSVKNYMRLDGRVAYNPTDWLTLALSGQGIAQASQTQSSAPKVERIGLFTVTSKF